MQKITKVLLVGILTASILGCKRGPSIEGSWETSGGSDPTTMTFDANGAVSITVAPAGTPPFYQEATYVLDGKDLSVTIKKIKTDDLKARKFFSNLPGRTIHYEIDMSQTDTLRLFTKDDKGKAMTVPLVLKRKQG